MEVRGSTPRRPTLRGYSSVGRAPALQAGGQEFESLYLHGDFQTVAFLQLSFFVMLNCTVLGVEKHFV